MGMNNEEKGKKRTCKILVFSLAGMMQKLFV
jgi:hypothetical protein